MPKVLHVQGEIWRADGGAVSPELMERLIRKILSLTERLGCIFRAQWRIGEPSEIEDRLG